MSGASAQYLHLVGCSHESAPLELRERLSLGPDTVKELYAALQAEGHLGEVAVLHTCNRLEIYVVGSSVDLNSLTRRIALATKLPVEEFQNHVYRLEGRSVVQHLFEVASGLKSQLVGETEIFGQVKNAYAEACQQRTAGKAIHKLFQKSFQAGKWARTHTAISQGHVSLGNIAVDLADRVFGTFKRSHALVVGGGDVGRDVTKALHSRGLKRISVTSRRAETAAGSASEVGGEVVPFDSWKEVLETTDVAIFATAAPGALLTRAELSKIMTKRGGDPLLLIDLAVPRDVEAACGDEEAVYLYNLADLSNIANLNRKMRESDVELCRQGLKQRTAATWSLLALP